MPRLPQLKESAATTLASLLAVFCILLSPVLTQSQEPGEDNADSAENRLAAIQSPLVSNVFYETDLREVLLNISSQTGVSIIADQTVRGFVTMEVRNLPLETCLQRILEPMGFAFRRTDNYYLVGKAHPDNPSFPLMAVSETIVPNYLKVDQVRNLISDFYKPFVKVDPQANRLTITASPDIVSRFKEYLSEIDRPSRQVTIEALVTEISQENMKEFGISAGFVGQEDGKAASLGIPLGDISDTTLSISAARIADHWSGWTVDYEVALKALLTEGKANIRANPKLTTLEGQTAKIFIGKDQYYTIATGVEPYVYTRLEVIKVGIALEITPYVSDSGTIMVEVASVVSDVTGMGVTGLPVINTRDVKTRVAVGDGESIVIGGLQTEDERRSVKKVPLLGDIPLLGALFKSSQVEMRQSQIVILVTPHIIKSRP